MRLIPVMLAFLFLTLWAQDIPQSAQDTLEQMNKDILGVQAKAYKDLMKQADTMGRQGRLDDALAIKKVADDLAVTIAANPAKAGGVFDGAGTPEAAFNGVWLPGGAENDAYTFKDGTATGTSEYQRASGWDQGTYKVTNGDNGPAVILSVKNGKVIKFIVRSNDELLEPKGSGSFKIWTRKK